MLRVFAEPPLRDPILLCAFTGWSDAAFAGSGALQFLLSKHSSQTIAEFDPDEVYSYTVTRPLTALDRSRQRFMRWPELNWRAVILPDQPHDLVLLSGPEPDLKWRGCVSEGASFAARLGITKTIALAAFYGPVPHTAAPAMIGVSASTDIRSRLTALGIGETVYEGPTGFLTALIDATNRAGITSAAIWVAAPSYLPGANNPKLSAALLRAVERLLRLDLDVGELEVAGREMERQIDEALRSRPDLKDFVKRLGGAQEGTPPAPPEEPQAQIEPDELPSAEEVLRALEEHLRRPREHPPESP